MIQRLADTFTAEPVERPEQNQVEFLPACCVEHSPERGAIVRLARSFVYILRCDLPTFRLFAFDEGAQLTKLVLMVLAFVLCAHARVQCNPHRSTVAADR